MVRHTLKILQHLLKDFKNMSDLFTTLRSKGLKSLVRAHPAKKYVRSNKKLQQQIYKILPITAAVKRTVKNCSCFFVGLQKSWGKVSYCAEAFCIFMRNHQQLVKLVKLLMIYKLKPEDKRYYVKWIYCE